MAWDPSDYENIVEHNTKQIGQVSMDSALGRALFSMAKSPKNRTFLEIGTWNGRGSTHCIVEGLKARAPGAPEPVFYSLECNAEKVAMAQELYKDISYVHILNEVLLTEMPADMKVMFPELLTNPTAQYWNQVDFDNMRGKPMFLERADLPPVFDVVLLDGGEYTTWYEYLALKNRCRVLALDDTNVAKCRKIVWEVIDDPGWKVILNSNERNGTFICCRSVPGPGPREHA
jgi:hypothetical protein